MMQRGARLPGGPGRRPRVGRRSFLGGALVTLAVCGASGPLAQTRPVSVEALDVAVDGRLARRHVTAVANGIGARVAGSAGERKAAAYIESSFRASGYVPSLQPFTFTAGRGRNQGGSRVSVVESANVVAVRAGRSTREIIIGAHYDSARAGRGADDNASGVGVMLEAAAALTDVSVPYTLRFVAFGAEEPGQWGSKRFVERMSRDAVRNIVAMINLDSLIAGDIAYVYGSPGAKGAMRDWVLRRAAGEGRPLVTQQGDNPDYPAGTTGPFSDHAAFEAAGIPYLYFESTNWTLGKKDGYVQVTPRLGEKGYIWHTEFDTLDYIDRTFPGRVDQRLELFSRMLVAMLTEFVAP